MTEFSGDTVVDYTIDVLREAIRTGRFAPGQRLIVADITREFAVSAGPVREAIRRLTGEGLVEIFPHRGASVRLVTIADLREVYQLREAIEGFAARLAADNVGEESFREELVKIQQEMEAIVRDGSTDRFIDNNRKLHDLIYLMARNNRMQQLALQLILPIYQLRLPHRMSTDDMHASYGGHQRIIAAILSGDGSLAEQAMRDHVCESGRGLIAVLENVEAERDARKRRGKEAPAPK